MHLSCLSYVLHALPIQVFLIAVVKFSEIGLSGILHYGLCVSVLWLNVKSTSLAVFRKIIITANHSTRIGIQNGAPSVVSQYYEASSLRLSWSFFGIRLRGKAFCCQTRFTESWGLPSQPGEWPNMHRAVYMLHSLMWHLVSDTEGLTYTEGTWGWGTEEDILA
jgi:hypothetical protein